MPQKKYRLLLLSGFLSLLFFPLTAQNNIYFKRFTTAEELPTSVLYKVFSDSRGFIWISGNTGISRFDGRHFINYGIAEGLTDNEVFDVLEDTAGNIWFNTLRGIPGYITPNNQVKVFNPAFFGDSIQINVIYFTRENDLWMTDRRNNIYHFKNDTLVKKYPYNIKEKIDGFIEDKKGRIWFSSTNTSVIHYFEGDLIKDVRIFDEDRIYITSHRPFLLKNGHLLLYGYDHFEVWDPVNMKMIYMHQFPTGKSAQIIAIYEGNDSRLWVGTTGGIITFTPDGKGGYSLSKSGILDGEKITSITQDFEGHYWISTINKGLIFIHGYPVLYYRFDDDMQGNTLNLCSSGEYIYAGTDDGKIYAIKNGVLSSIYSPENFFRFSRIMTSATLPNGHVWFGKDDGITVIHKDKVIKELDYNPVKKIVTDDNGHVWVGTSSSIFRINAETYVMEKKYNSGRVSALLYDGEGRIYFANEKGLNVIEKDSVYQVFGTPQFGNARISDLASDPVRHIIWVSTFGRGLFGIKNHNLEFHLDKTKGLTTNFIYSIECTPNGSLYLGLNKGINRIKGGPRGTLDIWAIDRQNGLIADEVNDIIHYNGYLWASTIDGICAIGENEEVNNMVPPKIYLNYFKVNGEDHTKSKDLTFQYNENNVEISLAGIAFQSGKSLKYQYKLEGLDTNYSYSASGDIKYNSLPAGTYTFVAHALNHQNLPSKKEVRITFTIYAAYWQTLWFQLFIGVILLIILLSGILVRIRLIKKKEEEKTRLNKMLGELELTALKAQMNPHFIFNSLGSIQNLINRDKKTEANIYLSKFAKLLRLTLDNSDKKEIALADEINMLELYLGLEGLRFNNQFEYKIEMDENVDIYEVKIPTMILQPFCENAIKHGLLPKKADASLSLHFSVVSDDTLHCVIQDNGIGRVQREKLKENSIAGHVSKGIKITRNRLELVNQLRNKPAEIKITDLYDDGGKAAGTRVDILIPFED